MPDVLDPWLWRQFLVYDEAGFDSYYISPNGRGRNVTNIDKWITKFSKDGNFCFKNLHDFENIHYEIDGKISDTCGFGSIYDFGTVDDNILYIIQLIWQYKADRWNNRDNEKFTCLNCRKMVQKWKEEHLEQYKKALLMLNTMNAEEFKTNHNYIYGKG